MKRVDFCRPAIPSGMDADSHGRAAISRERQESRAIVDDRRPEKRAVSDLEPLSYLYSVSRIFHSSPEQNANMVFAGIDIETPELGRLSQKGAAAGAVCVHLLYRARGRSYIILVFRGLSGLG